MSDAVPLSIRHGAGRTQGQVERVLALRTFPGFANLDPAHLAVVADIVVERFFQAGTALSVRGKPARSIHLIRRGSVNVLREGVPVRSLGAGDVVGGMAALTRDPSGQHVVAAQDTDTFEIDADDMEDVFEEHFPILLTVLGGMAYGVITARRSFVPSAGYRDKLTEPKSQPGELGLVERILFVRRLLAYGKSRVEAIADLTREMVEVRAEPGQKFWDENEPAPYSLTIVSGTVRCESLAGHAFRFGPDSVIGGIDSLAGKPRWYAARAETEVVALRSEVANLIDVIEDHPDMGIEMVRVMARALLELQAAQDVETLGSSGSDPPLSQ